MKPGIIIICALLCGFCFSLYAETCAGNVCAAAPSGAAAAAPQEAKIAEIGTDALAAMVKAGAGAILLDARSGKWDDGRRIPGAKSLNAQSSAEDIAAVVPAKNSLVVTYCSNPKCPASDMLAKHLLKLGYTNIIEYPAGIDGWAAAGQPIEKAK